MTSIDNKVQTLADKIYADGVEKANREAEEIIGAANEKRDHILKEAQKEAEEIVANAQRAAQKEKETAESEIDMAATRALESLRTEVTDLLNESAVSSGVKEAMPTPEKMFEVVLKMAEAWSRGEGVEIRTEEAEMLEAYFAKHAQEELKKGVRIEAVNGKKHHFELQPKESGFKMEIGPEELKEYFKEFFRPRLRTRLFPEKA